MLLNVLLSEGELSQKLLTVLVMLLALVPAFTLHEWAHGFVAYKLGDPTAKYDRRLSINPLDHIDPVGAILLLLFGFGWAKPVPVNMRRLKHPKRDFALCSAAGPLMNLLLAAVSAMLLTVSSELCFRLGASVATYTVVFNLFLYSMVFNISLAVFNLIPIPPLDGSNIVVALLPQRLAIQYLKIRYYTRYLFIGLFILTRVSALSGLASTALYPLNWANSSLQQLMLSLGNAVSEWIFG